MLAMLSFLLLAQRAGVQDPRRTYAAGEKDALLMLPPVTVCDGDVQDMVWTADGSSLVVRRTVTAMTTADVAAMASGKPPSPEEMARFAPKTELLVWSIRSHKARVVSTVDAQRTVVTEMRAMPGTDRVVLGASEPGVDANGAATQVTTVSMLATGSGTITRLAATDESTPMVGFVLSPKRPLGYLSAYGANRARSARFFGADGRLGNAVALPARSQVDFDPLGAPFLFLGAERKVKGKPSVFHLQKIDLAAGALGAAYDSPMIEGYDPSPSPDDFKAVPVAGTADGARAPSILLRLAGGKPTEAGVVTTDGERGLVSPKGDAVAYVSQGSAVVRPLAKVSRKEYESALLAAQKAIAMSTSKQVALGLIMFAADMDDVLPTQGDYQKVDPYLRDSKMRDAFSYTFAGGDMSKIDKPAETEIGYVPGPGGRAVAYADGHVRWVPNP